MPKKIRVYELARELGLTNKEALDLCLALGIGVKSHSSSIEDAQADRVRRKADSEGLRRAVSARGAGRAEAGPGQHAARRRTCPPTTRRVGPHRARHHGTPRPGPPSRLRRPPGPRRTAPTPPPALPWRPTPDRQRLVTSRPASEVSVPPPPPARRPRAPARTTPPPARTTPAPAAPGPPRRGRLGARGRARPRRAAALGPLRVRLLLPGCALP